MLNVKKNLISVFAMLVLVACASPQSPLSGMEEVQPASVTDIPETNASDFPAEQVDRGRYMVTLLGCGNCHTDGALVGQPDSARILAGSNVGIAYTNPLQDKYPGVVYPANLTPDRETGLGNWTVEQIVLVLQSGINNHGGQTLPVMPWQAYSRLTPEDAQAVDMYLKTLPSVIHEVPENVRPGKRAKHPYVHFGVYQSEQ